MKLFDGKVISQAASRFYVSDGAKTYVCFARKKLKTGGDIFVGDKVRFVKDSDGCIIEEVLPRKNSLVRPYVANVDICLIMIASVPEPDFVLVDKVIVNCLHEGITPILVVNKCDLGVPDMSEYTKVVETYICSAETLAGIPELLKRIAGNTVCFAGQSAVGKSSVINAILNSGVLEVGEMSKKAKRGKHTTRRTEILDIGSGTYLVDTCGFSMLDTIDIEPERLRLYFDDMEEYRKNCRFNACTHTVEPDCAVKPEVGKGVGVGRYERYKQIYAELKTRREEKYE
jgi:ribosome biogenesis GTPase